VPAPPRPIAPAAGRLADLLWQTIADLHDLAAPHPHGEKKRKS
jgi:hypothetical protein